MRALEELKQTIKVDTLHGDEANKILVNYHGDSTWTEAEEKKLVRKIDIRLLTILCLTYGLQYYDKVSRPNKDRTERLLGHFAYAPLQGHALSSSTFWPPHRPRAHHRNSLLHVSGNFLPRIHLRRLPCHRPRPKIPHRTCHLRHRVPLGHLLDLYCRLLQLPLSLRPAVLSWYARVRRQSCMDARRWRLVQERRASFAYGSLVLIYGLCVDGISAYQLRPWSHQREPFTMAIYVHRRRLYYHSLVFPHLVPHATRPDQSEAFHRSRTLYRRRENED